MNKQSSRSSLFLIELVLSIFFFIIAAAICLQLFVNTYFLSRETIEINQAVLWSQNLAEPFLGGMGDYSIVKELYSDKDCSLELSFSSDNHLLLCFDKNWNYVDSFAKSYYVVFSVNYKDESFSYQDIYIAKSPKSVPFDTGYNDFTDLLCEKDYQIYQLSVKKFLNS